MEWRLGQRGIMQTHLYGLKVKVVNRSSRTGGLTVEVVEESLAFPAYAKGSRLNVMPFDLIPEQPKANPEQPRRRARHAALRKALAVALRELPEDDVVAVIASDWLSCDRLDKLQGTLP